MNRILILVAISFLLCSTASAFQGGGGESTKKESTKKKVVTKKKTSGTPSANTTPKPPTSAVRTRTPPPAPATAELNIRSTPPNSSILIDGQSIGVTDEGGLLNLPSLKAGEHIIIGRKERYRDAQRTIILEANRNQTVQLDLSPMPGTLNINVNVGGARIEINDQGNYADKVSNLELDAGSYSVKASKPGYGTATQRVDIGAGQRSDVSLTLEPAVEEILAEAEKEFRNRRYNEAIAISRNILANNASQPRANWLIGQSYFKMQKYYESIPYLANAIALGEQVILPITHRHGGQFGFNVDDDLCVGRLIFGKNLLEFQSLTGITMSSVNFGPHNFRTTMGQIYELKFDNIDQGGEIHLVVGVDEKGKEKRKRYDLYSPQATLTDKRSRSGQALGMIIRCDDCPEMMPALFQLLRLLQSRQAKQ